jgi:hypothetical protein
MGTTPYSDTLFIFRVSTTNNQAARTGAGQPCLK